MLENKNIENFKNLYNEVFDDDNKIKAYGREKCKNLIKSASLIKPNIYFGDEKTGFINIENMTKLKKEL